MAKDLKQTSIFPEGLCERVRLRAGVNFRLVDFGKVEPEFSGVGPSVDLFWGRRTEVEVLDEALALDVDGPRLEQTVRPVEIKLKPGCHRCWQFSFGHFCNFPSFFAFWARQIRSFATLQGTNLSICRALSLWDLEPHVRLVRLGLKSIRQIFFQPILVESTSH